MNSFQNHGIVCLLSCKSVVKHGVGFCNQIKSSNAQTKAAEYFLLPVLLIYLTSKIQTATGAVTNNGIPGSREDKRIFRVRREFYFMAFLITFDSCSGEFELQRFLANKELPVSPAATVSFDSLNNM